MKIRSLKTWLLNESDRLTIASLLIKAGYWVRLGKEKTGTASKYEYFVEAFGEEELLEKFNLQ